MNLFFSLSKNPKLILTQEHFLGAFIILNVGYKTYLRNKNDSMLNIITFDAFSLCHSLSFYVKCRLLNERFIFMSYCRLSFFFRLSVCLPLYLFVNIFFAHLIAFLSVRLRKAAKNLFLMARPLRGGGGKGLATKKKRTFINNNYRQFVLSFFVNYSTDSLSLLFSAQFQSVALQP